MLKIGDFSKLSMISVRMLRHYDENGLLVPVEVDRFSGYRYYSEEQLGLAMRITALRDIGFGVSAIREIIERSDDTHYIETMYIARREELYREYSRAAAKLSAVTSALESLNAGNHLREENNMNYTVTEKTFPESYAATVRMTIPSYEHEGMIWSVLVSETAGMNIVPADPCLCSVVFHDGEFKETDVDIEARKTVTGHYPDTEHVKFRTIPAVTCATVVHKGSYAKIGEANAAVAKWVRENGYSFAGNMFNIYYVSPHETSNPDEFVTEVCYPIAK